MKKLYLAFFLALTLGYSSQLPAEIQKIVVRYNAFKCLDICLPTLSQNVRSIPGAQDVQFDSHAGTIQMGWNPRTSFSFEPFNFALRASGLRVSDIRLRVQGTISHDTQYFYLVSSGDRTRFRLIGQLQPDPSHYNIQRSIYNHPLSDSVKQELMAAEAQNLQVIIEGPLFGTERAELNLTTQQVNVQKPRPVTGPKTRGVG